MREYGEARQNYQLALAINIEFGDRYFQSFIHNNLGYLAASENNLTEAAQNLLQALKIFFQFQDRHNMEKVVNSLSRIYQATQDRTGALPLQPIIF